MHINNYTILNKIGEGGMAKVYFAEHKMLGYKVAIKVLNNDLIQNNNSLVMCRQKAPQLYTI